MTRPGRLGTGSCFKDKRHGEVSAGASRALPIELYEKGKEGSRGREFVSKESTGRACGLLGREGLFGGGRSV